MDIARLSKNLPLVAKRLDQALEIAAGERVQFSLLIWSTRPGEPVQYISSTQDRPAIARAMREVIDRWEAGMPDVPAHEKQ